MRAGIRIPCHPPIFQRAAILCGPYVRFKCSLAFRMRKPCLPSQSLRIFLALSIVALSCLAGCGKLRTWLKPENPHSVTIGWTPAKPPVAGYNVYRESQFSGAIKLTTRIVSGTQYTDKTVVADRTYSYY